jgi:ferrous iron transport protein B
VREGIVAGVAGTAVFVPQIFLLFLLIGLLEDSGYLARAAFVAERILRRFGLPGHAFIPFLSAHACAVPAIMSARLVPDRRDRLVTILVAPLMSCSARLPVYVLLIGLLFPGRPIAAALAFSGCYATGAGAAILIASLLRRSAVGGRARPLVMELPVYQWPSLRSAARAACDRAIVFLRHAATVILAISVVSWWLSAYPLPDPGDPRPALAQSSLARLGRLVQPVFAPLGFDWQLSVALCSSFAAREVFVSTMAVMSGDGGGSGEPLLERIRSMPRDDGTPVFTTSTAAGLLVFYVLAMQCLPTLAVTRREAGGWRWAALQLVLMSGLAWGAAFVVRRAMILLGVP